MASSFSIHPSFNLMSVSLEHLDLDAPFAVIDVRIAQENRFQLHHLQPMEDLPVPRMAKRVNPKPGTSKTPCPSPQSLSPREVAYCFSGGIPKFLRQISLLFRP